MAGNRIDSFHGEERERGFCSAEIFRNLAGNWLYRLPAIFPNNERNFPVFKE
jgi:hypothetical protein